MAAEMLHQFVSVEIHWPRRQFLSLTWYGSHQQWVPRYLSLSRGLAQCARKKKNPRTTKNIEMNGSIL